MKALTVRQPWASLIACGEKKIETRSRATQHRGPLAIHAGTHRPVPGDEIGGWWWDWDVDRGIIVDQNNYPQRVEYPAPLGAIVAVAEVIDCVPSDPTLWDTRTGGPWTGHARNGDGSDATLLWSDQQGNRHTYDWSQQSPFCDFENNGWAWLLADVRPLTEPIPCRGAQGLWTAPISDDELLQAVAS